MGMFLKFVLHLMANILWQKIGGKGAIPPVRLPKGKKPVSIPVVSPWQTVVVMWTARKMWAAFGGQFKDILASSPNGAAQHLGTLLPDAPAKPKKPGASKAASPAPSASAASRAPQTWTGTAKPAPAPAPPSPPAASAPSAAPMPAPRSAPNYATRPLNHHDVAPDDTSTTAPAAAVPPVAVPPTPVDSPAAPASKLRPGSLLSSLRRRS